jgi:hypothetical protein
MTVAALRDRTGSYDAGFGLLMVLAAAGALAVTALPLARQSPTGTVREAVRH